MDARKGALRQSITHGVDTVISDRAVLPDFINMRLEQLEALATMLADPDTIATSSAATLAGVMWIQSEFVHQLKALVPHLPGGAQQQLREAA